MTAKRFELRLCNNGIYYLWDNNELTDIDFDQFNKESANGIVDLLNELAEENEQLKTKNFAYLQDIEVFKEENTHLKLENEQLRQRNDRQAKQLDNLYRLIKEKDWRTLTDILDDFKQCEEQLQREWRTYE